MQLVIPKDTRHGGVGEALEDGGDGQYQCRKRDDDGDSISARSCAGFAVALLPPCADQWLP